MIISFIVFKGFKTDVSQLRNHINIQASHLNRCIEILCRNPLSKRLAQAS